MKLRTAEDLGRTIREARRARGWNQRDLGARAGVSRQWISMVENGKTSVEFDLALDTLRALGCDVLVESQRPSEPSAPRRHAPSGRTRLTRGGKPLPDRLG